MTREDAYYEKIMLLCGYWDNYDEWLDSYLETEDPISNIVLESILDDINNGNLEIDMAAEDIHMFVEGELTKRIGDVGKQRAHCLLPIFLQL